MTEKLLPDIKPHYEVKEALEQTKALASLAQAATQISNFLTNGGLANILSGYARSQAVKDILGGLATHDGRNALDARLLDQTALEIVTQVEKVFEKYKSKLEEKNTDLDLHNAENDYNTWAKTQGVHSYRK